MSRRDRIRSLLFLRLFDTTAIRRLKNSPRFTTVTVLTLGLGIGANTALFSVVHSVLLNPLPYTDSEQLVFAWETRGEGNRRQAVSLGNFQEWRNASSGFQSIAAARYRPYNVTGLDRPFRINGLEASAGLLALLGTRPHHGREFSTDEEQPGARPVCLVSNSFWLERLGGKTDLTDTHLLLNGVSHAVVGVLPSGLRIPGFGVQHILTPVPLDPSQPGFWSNHNTTVYGRLGTNIQIEQAGEALALVASRLEETVPEWNEGIGSVLIPAREQLVRGASRTLWILFGTVGFVLLIACVNVANLLLARAASAEREIAVRVALGAFRTRIVTLVLSEALLLSVAGGLLGLGIGYWGVEAIRMWGPANLPRLSEIEISVPVLSFTMACAALTGILFGLVPALRSMRVDIQSTLNKSGRSPGLGASHRVQRVFVVAEVAIAVVLLTCSGLLVKSFINLMKVDPGFSSDGRYAMQLSLPSSRYTDGPMVSMFLNELHQRLDGTPGIETSGSSVGLPFQSLMWRKYLTLEHQPALTLSEIPIVDLSISTAGYLRTMGIPVLEGRALLESDNAESPFVALVSETFVRTHLNNGEVIGKRLRLAAPDHLLPPEHVGLNPWYTIVGVVGDVRRWSLSADPLPEVYITQQQDQDNAHGFFVVVHTRLSTEGAGDVMRQAVWDIDPELPVTWVQPIDAMFSNAVAQPRFNVTLVSAFGLSALLLALIGIYGLLANIVGARTQEIGVRIALGARPGQILRHVAGQGIAAAGTGIAIGIALSAAGTRVMDTLLFGVQPIDLSTFVAVTAAVLCVAVVAASLPSWRAARLNAIEALGAE
jgi:putative ABC transport system permease protein